MRPCPSKTLHDLVSAHFPAPPHLKTLPPLTVLGSSHAGFFHFLKQNKTKQNKTFAPSFHTLFPASGAHFLPNLDQKNLLHLSDSSQNVTSSGRPSLITPISIEFPKLFSPQEPALLIVVLFCF
jgi:hypothetical protein